MTDDSPAQLLADRVRQERAAAATVMTSLSGNRSACAMGRNGQPFPAYKYHEGTAAALGDLGRRLRKADGNDLHTVVAAVVDQWRREVDRRAGDGRDWQAYAAGGLEAVQGAAAWLDESQ